MSASSSCVQEPELSVISRGLSKYRVPDRTATRFQVPPRRPVDYPSVRGGKKCSRSQPLVTWTPTSGAQGSEKQLDRLARSGHRRLGRGHHRVQMLERLIDGKRIHFTA